MSHFPVPEVEVSVILALAQEHLHSGSLAKFPNIMNPTWHVIAMGLFCSFLGHGGAAGVVVFHITMKVRKLSEGLVVMVEPQDLV